MINIIKEQYDKIQEIYRIKSMNLIKAIEDSKKKLNKNETRRNLELSGYVEDLKLLDKKVQFYENYVNKLKHLVEEDA
jgi:flagellar motility protein MotE (MotC chaperone)